MNSLECDQYPLHIARACHYFRHENTATYIPIAISRCPNRLQVILFISDPDGVGKELFNHHWLISLLIGDSYAIYIAIAIANSICVQLWSSPQIILQLQLQRYLWVQYVNDVLCVMSLSIKIIKSTVKQNLICICPNHVKFQLNLQKHLHHAYIISLSSGLNQAKNTKISTTTICFQKCTWKRTEQISPHRIRLLLVSN